MKESKDAPKNLSLPLILFDSECPLCCRFKQALERLPGTERYNFVSIHEEKIYSIYTFLSKESCNKDLHVIDGQDKIYVGSEAIRHLVSQFPGTSKFTWLIESNMGKKTVDYFYKMADRYRESLLNWCSDCKR